MSPQTIAAAIRCATRTAAIVGALAGAFALSAHAQTEAEADSPAGESASPITQFIGTFSLVEYAPHGDEPIGRISYDGAGRMWAMILPPNRAPLTGTASAEDYRAAMRGVVAYYGTYDVDEATGRVIHHVEAASNPAWIGDDFVRWYRFEDGDLRLSLNADFRGTLLWARMPAE